MKFSNIANKKYDPSILGILTVFWSPKSPGNSGTVTQPVRSERKSQWQWGRGRERLSERRHCPGRPVDVPLCLHRETATAYLTTDKKKKKILSETHDTCTRQKCVKDVFPSGRYSFEYILLFKSNSFSWCKRRELITQVEHMFFFSQ